MQNANCYHLAYCTTLWFLTNGDCCRSMREFIGFFNWHIIKQNDTVSKIEAVIYESTFECETATVVAELWNKRRHSCAQ